MYSSIKKLISTRKFKLIAGVALLQIILAILIVFFIECSNNLWDFGATFHLIASQPLVFIFNIAVISLIGITISAIFNSIVIGNGVVFAVAYALMYVNAQKLYWRGFPILPEDFLLLSEADSLVEMVNVGEVVISALAIIAVVIFTIFASKCLKRKHNIPNYKNKNIIIARISVFIVGFLGVILLTAPIRSLSSENSYIEVPWLNAQIVVWDQSANFRNNGFILSFIYNLQQRKMERPDGYSEKAIREIVEKYQKIANSQVIGEKSDIDIIYVMNESFADPKKLMEEFPFEGEDPIPFTRNLMSRTSSGQISTPAYGGATADVEFEALTGLSMFFLQAVPYTNMVSRQPDFPSIVSQLDRNNYETTAIHLFAGAMYKRDIVYRNLGFNKFIDDTGIEYSPENTFNTKISDRYAYDLVLNQLSSSQKNQFIFLVTMQNHMPFTETPPNERFRSIADVDPERRTKIDSFMVALNESDHALSEFISQVKKLPKKTLVVFFGDHLPGVYGEREGVELVGNREALLAHYQTPLFIYANFPMENKDLGVISPIFLNNEALSVVRIKKSPFNFLLDKLRQQNTVLNRRVIDLMPVEESEVLNDYRMIQYDTMSGQKYALKMEFFN